MISGRIEVNQFAQIRLKLAATFGENPHKISAAASNSSIIQKLQKHSPRGVL